MARNAVANRDAADQDAADHDEANHDAPLHARAMDAMRSANQTVRRTANIVVDRAPAAVERSQEALDEASRRVQGESKETITLAAMFAAGLWLGLVLSRAPRLFSSAAALPAMVLAGAFLARREVGRRSGATTRSS
jgi:ElaB/YqjD/DUF883 family membrane-anchored ribosome-binding protein